MIVKYVQSLRNFRHWHRYLGLFLAFFLLISSLTGVLLAWKKDVATLQPPTQKGSSTDLTTFKPLAELVPLAEAALKKQYPEQADNAVDKLDLRPSKGIAKVLFEQGNWEVQIDCSTGEIKSIGKRHADWIEQLHDGSIISDAFKLVSMNLLGFGLMLLLFSGLWLWYAPKIIRKIKKSGKPFSWGK
jgi:uncharacterized iron-regulated membrane protein